MVASRAQTNERPITVGDNLQTTPTQIAIGDAKSVFHICARSSGERLGEYNIINK